MNETTTTVSYQANVKGFVESTSDFPLIVTVVNADGTECTTAITSNGNGQQLNGGGDAPKSINVWVQLPVEGGPASVQTISIPAGGSMPVGSPTTQRQILILVRNFPIVEEDQR